MEDNPAVILNTNNRYRGCFTEHIDSYKMYCWVVYQRGKRNDSHSWAEQPPAVLAWKVSGTSQKVLKFEGLRCCPYFWSCFHQGAPAEQILVWIFKVQQSQNSCCSWWRYSAVCSEASLASLHSDSQCLCNSPKVIEGTHSNRTWVPSLTNLSTFSVWSQVKLSGHL